MAGWGLSDMFGLTGEAVVAGSQRQWGRAANPLTEVSWWLTAAGVPCRRGLSSLDFSDSVDFNYTTVGGGVKWAASGCWAADGFRCHPGRMGHVVPEFLSFAIFSQWSTGQSRLKLPFRTSVQKASEW